MDSAIKDFLNHTFEIITNEYPQSTIEYKFSESTNSHIVKVTPEHIYNSESFLSLEGEFYKHWLSLSIEEDFGIVTKGSIVDTNSMKLIYAPPIQYHVTICYESESVINITANSERVRLYEPAFENNSEGRFSETPEYAMAA